MTRNKWIASAFIFLVVLLLLEICIGTHGLTYIACLKKQVAELAYEAQVKQVKVDALSQRSKDMSQGEGIQDAAFKLGYQKEEEQVYFFDQPGAQEPTPETSVVRKEYHYVHLPLWANVLVALAVSLASVVVFTIRQRRKELYG